MRVLSDEAWSVLAPTIEACRPSLDLGTGPRSSLSAGRSSARGNACWRWPRTRASGLAWCIGMARSSARTPRRPVQGKGSRRKEAEPSTEGPVCSWCCRVIAFALGPGQAHELSRADSLLDRLPDRPLWVVGDKGYSAHAPRECSASGGWVPAGPSRTSATKLRCGVRTSSTSTATRSSGCGAG